MPNWTISYIFKGKMAKVRGGSPYPEEFEIGDTFMTESWFPSVTDIVMNVGAHEVVGWTKRPIPNFNLSEFGEDIDSFLDKLDSHGYQGRLIWWNGNSPRGVRFAGGARENFFAAQQLGCQKFKQRNATTLDLVKISEGNPSLVDVGGIHYGRGVKFQQMNVVLRALCNMPMSPHLHSI
jgi:hypothetical protein